jgi:type II secretion system protein H
MTLETFQPRAERRRAFTLIELILVMALLIVTTTFLAPQLSEFFRGRSLDSEAKRFLALTRLAQSRAVAEGVPVVVWIDAQQRTYGIEVQPGFLLELDDKAAQYELGRDIEIEAQLPLTQPVALRSEFLQQTVARAFGNLPAMVFSPEGTISETSPDAVVLRRGEKEAVAVVLARNQLNYEVQPLQQ